jgi:hypothetical protein
MGYIHRQRARLDQRMVSQGSKWSEIEKDDSRGRAPPEHTASGRGCAHVGQEMTRVTLEKEFQFCEVRYIIRP